MWQIRNIVVPPSDSKRLIEYSSSCVRRIHRWIYLALSHRLMTHEGGDEREYSWSWIHRDSHQGRWRFITRIDAINPTLHSIHPRRSHTWRTERKGINKKLRDHIMENIQITINRIFCVANVWIKHVVERIKGDYFTLWRFELNACSKWRKYRSWLKCCLNRI